MANEFRGSAGHSAEYFGDTRDHWWNADYLALIARRFGFELVKDALDVGCGVGHWGQLLSNVLPATVRVHGVDPDADWVAKAAQRAAEQKLSERFFYSQGTAERLPFPDSSFDLVTCQTVLIHVADPGAAIDEMMRVLRPGGLILMAEPNNIATSLVFDSVSDRWPIDTVMDLSRFQLTCERGKAELGEGNNSIGDRLPGLFAQHGLRDIRVYLSDKTFASWPPYATPEQRTMADEAADLSQRNFWIWSQDDTRRFFSAGGGEDSAFDRLWALALDGARESREAVANATYSSGGGTICYLIGGRKDADR